MNAPQITLPPVWPEGQKMTRWQEPSVVLTQFTDTAAFHDQLIKDVLAQSENPQFTKRYEQVDSVGSAKVFDLPKWNSEPALLVHERAVELFRKVANTETVYTDLSWASIYRDGDLCMAHSHPRTTAGIVYMLDLGDPPSQESGMFLFADPRMDICCREQKGFMSTPSAPLLTHGSMIMFPGAAVHCVTPYHGTRPRITLSWNFNLKPVAGEPLPPQARPPGQS